METIFLLNLRKVERVRTFDIFHYSFTTAIES